MKHFILREILIVICLLILSFPAVKALLQPGGFTSHDLTHHIVRQISMDKLLSEGQFPPRWSGQLNNGYGYPVFLFNYPFPALVGEVFHKLGLGFVDSVKAVLFTSLIISVLGMYLFLKKLLGSKPAAFLGAMFYLYSPHRFLNVYVSASVGSVLAEGLIPFVFLSMLVTSKQKKWGSVLGGISLASLILSHNVTALIFTPLILVFATFLIWRSEQRIKVFRQLGVMFLLGLGISAWFWLPAIVEKQYIRFDDVFAKFYQDQFPSPWQLIRSPWGYGLSHPQHPEIGDMSYQLGLVHILVIILLILMLPFKRRIREVREIGGFSLIFFILSVALMLKTSLPVWEKLPFLSIIQFPLRFQTWSVFACSIATALLIKYLPYKKLLLFGLLFLVIYANRNHWNINEKFDPGEDYYFSLKTTSTSYGEHLPKWGRVMQSLALSKLEFVQGGGNIKITENKSNKVLAEVEATGPAKLRLNQFYFPGWQIEVDNKIASFDYLVDGQSYGLPMFDIDKGFHQIKAEFKNTVDRNLGDFISELSVILLGILICRLLILK